MATEGCVYDELASVSGGIETRSTEEELKIRFQDCFRGIPREKRMLKITNPTEIGCVRRRPLKSPSPQTAPGACLGKTTPSPNPQSINGEPTQVVPDPQPLKEESLNLTPIGVASDPQVQVLLPSGKQSILGESTQATQDPRPLKEESLNK
jgi:hypothetical protein